MFVRFDPWVRGAIKIGRECFAPRPMGQVATPCPEEGRRARSVWADRITVVGGRETLRKPTSVLGLLRAGLPPCCQGGGGYL